MRWWSGMIPGTLVGVHFATFPSWGDVAPSTSATALLFYLVLLPLVLLPPARAFGREETWRGPLRYGAVMGASAWVAFLACSAAQLGDLGGFSHAQDPLRVALGIFGLALVAAVPCAIGAAVALVGARVGLAFHGIKERRASGA